MLSRWFLSDGFPFALCTAYSYDARLVGLSYLIAVVAAYTAFDVIDRIRAASDPVTRVIWLITAGVSMGFGVWAMHFIAMLAVEIPLSIHFDLRLTVLSACFAVVASTLAFHLVSGENAKRLRLALGGVVLALGIGAMHYTGMAALRMQARIFYDPWLFVLSLAVAVSLSTSALTLLSMRLRVTGGRLRLLRLAGATVMGLAIVLMHYTGMLATYVYPEPGQIESGILFDPPIMAAAVAVASLSIVAVSMVAAWFDRRIEQADALLRDAIENFSEGFVVYDENDRLVMCNQAYKRMYAESADLLVFGTRYEEIAWRGLQQGKYPDALGREAEWLATRIRERREAVGTFERQLRDGTWILESDRPMRNGATAGLRIDISTLKATQEALRESERRLDRAQEIAGIGSWELDVHTGLSVWSNELFHIRGLRKGEELPSIDILKRLTHPDDWTKLAEWLDALKRGMPREPIEYRILRPDHQMRIVRSEGRPVADPSGTINKLTGTLQDVTDRRRTEQQLDIALNNLTQGVCFFDGDRKLILANRRYAEIYHLSPELLRPGTSLEDVVAERFVTGTAPGMAREEYLTWRASISARGEPNDSVVELTNGQIISIHRHPMSDGGWISTHEDVTERHRAELRLAHIARHDALTGLPNRIVFREFVEQEQVRHEHGRSIAVLCLDLDRFKFVNDTFGHPAGDALLCAVARRIAESIRPDDIVVRLGGDEFAIVQTSVDQPNQAAGLAQRLIEVLSEPYDLGQRHVVIGVSIGIAYRIAQEADAQTLLKHADMALYLSKARGRGTYSFFDPVMDVQARARQSLDEGLRAALVRQEFELFFQPILNVQTEAVVRFEALIRWRRPGHGLVEPSKFISFSEEIGLIVPIGEWVLREACMKAATWPDSISVAVNISAVQLKSERLLEVMRDALEISRLSPSRLELEVTETVLLEDSVAALRPLHQLRDLGCRISLDDFGTGFSSIGCLQSFPFDRVKIDQSFVRKLDQRPDSIAIVHAIVDLGCALNMSVTAEGVETREQLRMLRAEACSEVQGFLFSKPVPAGEVPALIEQFSSDRSEQVSRRERKAMEPENLTDFGDSRL